MILPYMCPIIENVPTFCILKENTFQINNLRRKQRDGKSHKKTTLLCISIFSGAWGALLKFMNDSFGSSTTDKTLT